MKMEDLGRGDQKVGGPLESVLPALVGADVLPLPLRPPPPHLPPPALNQTPPPRLFAKSNGDGGGSSSIKTATAAVIGGGGYLQHPRLIEDGEHKLKILNKR